MFRDTYKRKTSLNQLFSFFFNVQHQKKRDPRFSFSKLKGRPHSLRTAGLNRDEQHKQKPVLKQALSYTHGKKEPSELKATLHPRVTPTLQFPICVGQIRLAKHVVIRI